VELELTINNSTVGTAIKINDSTLRQLDVLTAALGVLMECNDLTTGAVTERRDALRINISNTRQQLKVFILAVEYVRCFETLTASTLLNNDSTVLGALEIASTHGSANL